MSYICTEFEDPVCGLPEDPPHYDWISVEDQPEPEENGLYRCKGYWLGSGRPAIEDDVVYCGEWDIVNNFVLTHWMPQPPKE